MYVDCPLLSFCSSVSVVACSFSSCLFFLLSEAYLSTYMYKWSSWWDYGTYHIGGQRRLRQACASVQSCQSLRCAHKWSMEVGEGADQKSDIKPHWMAARALWRMSLRRTKSTINSGADSNIIFFPACTNNKLGISNRSLIPDAQMSAHLSRTNISASEGRLGASGQGWCGSNTNSWLQVDLG